MDHSFAITAIARNELPFIDEWIAYHRIIGVNHFYLYDDDPQLPLKKHLAPYSDFVTVIDWHDIHQNFPGLNRQYKSYKHSLQFVRQFDWVSFVDIDEFIVIPTSTVQEFMSDHAKSTLMFMHTRIFGNNGYVQNPEGLITASLTKRQACTDHGIHNMYKTINRANTIREIVSCHTIQHTRKIVDRPDDIHVNHYMFRSYEHWKSRKARGGATDDNPDYKATEKWKGSDEGWETFNKTFNNVEDTGMLPFKNAIEVFIKQKRSEAR